MKYSGLILFLLGFISCTKEQFTQQVSRPELCDSFAFTFQEDIDPIFTAYCNFNDCHDADGASGYDLTRYAVVAERIRFGTMDHRLNLPLDDPQHMPLNLQLTACDYYIIKTWIDQGYPEK